MLKWEVERLRNLFDQENIEEGHSFQLLKDLGGLEGLEKFLSTNFKVPLVQWENGLEDSEQVIEKRKQKYGTNLPSTRPTDLWEQIFFLYDNLLAKIICFLAIVSITLGFMMGEGKKEGIFVLVSITIYFLSVSLLYYIKEKIAWSQKLTRDEIKVQVIRSGNLKQISQYDLVVGDILQIQKGQHLVADGVLIHGGSVLVDEISISGDSSEVKKSPFSENNEDKRCSFLLKTSIILQGTGLLVVCSVGQNSSAGQIDKDMIDLEFEDFSPFQETLQECCKKINSITFLLTHASLGFILYHFVRDSFGETERPPFLSLYTVQQFASTMICYFCFGLTTSLELNLFVKLYYFLNFRKMQRDNILVKDVWCLGRMLKIRTVVADSSVFIDSMEVTKLLIQGEIFSQISNQICSKEVQEILSFAVINTSSAEPESWKVNKQIIMLTKGDQMECALLEMALEMGYDYHEFRSQKTRCIEKSRKKLVAISQIKERKYMFVRGQPDSVFPSCSHYVGSAGEVAAFDEEAQSYFEETALSFESEKRIPVLLAYKQIQDGQTQESNLTIIGLVGVSYFLKEGIRDTVENLKESQVGIKIVSSFNKERTFLLGKQVGVVPNYLNLNKDGNCVQEGSQFTQSIANGEQVNMEVFPLASYQLHALAHASSNDKRFLTLGLKESFDGVAFVGVGSEDLESLKISNLSISIEEKSSVSVKGVSDIILFDDKLQSLPQALKWGRNLLQSVKKLFQFELVLFLTYVIIVMIGFIFNSQCPFSTAQMLWIPLMAIIESLSLTHEPIDKCVPYDFDFHQEKKIVNIKMAKNTIMQILFQTIILCGILFHLPELIHIPSSVRVTDFNQETGKHYTILFNVFAYLNIFNMLNSRSLEDADDSIFNVFNNPLLSKLFFVTLVVQYVIGNYGGAWIRTVELSQNENMLCLVLGSSSLLADAVIRAIRLENWISKGMQRKVETILMKLFS